MPDQQLLGSLSQHPANLTPFALDPGDSHRLVGGGLVPHPCNDSGFGTLPDRDSLRPGDYDRPSKAAGAPVIIFS